MLGQHIRSGITIHNLTPSIQAAVEKEIFTDDGSLKTLTSGSSTRWGRKAGTYKIQLKDGAEEFNIILTKTTEEVKLVILGLYDVHISGHVDWKWENPSRSLPSSPPPSSSSPRPRVEMEVSFLSYNMNCLPGIAEKIAKYTAPTACVLPAERIEHFAKTHLEKYDILCMQEVWNPHYSTIEKYAKAKGLHVVGSAPPHRHLLPAFYGAGLMIVSKFPIVLDFESSFCKGIGDCQFVTKGVVYVKLMVGPHFVHVFNTHLQASYEKEGPATYAKIRRTQITKIAKFIEERTKNDQHPIILLGDFNVNAIHTTDPSTSSDEYKSMIEILQGDLLRVVDLLKNASKSRMHPITYNCTGVTAKPIPDHGECLDFILDITRKSDKEEERTHEFLKNEVVPFFEDGHAFTQCSDHYAISTTLHFLP